ncbi:porin [Silvimonas terrae]|uniref:Porin n=1 Tax=Silvimonas terrae TaxID=300266 RepID=A0A840REF2_9NEIS|nr:carbohydrate porin [Silvimonas terrae]MBB5190898.1 porin [Silvimonas terrae]
MRNILYNVFRDVLMNKKQNSRQRNLTLLRLTCAVLAATSFQARAEAIDDARTDATKPEADQSIAATTVGQWTGAWTRGTLLGDMGGLRSGLAQYGINLGLTETSEYLGNVSGGTDKGFVYDGLTTLTLTMDTSKALGLQGGTFNVSAINIHGRNLSELNLSNLQTASGIESDSGTRLWELWYQQSLADNKYDVKVGQQSIDQEFMTSTYSGLFVNTMMGWPAVPSYDLPSGGPAYPMSALGVRLRAHPTDAITVLAGAFAGDPTAVNGGNHNGTGFSLHGGTLWIAEVQYAVNQPALGQLETANNNPDEPPHHSGLPGTYKLGMWYHTASFDDQRNGTDGLSLADPNSNGSPQQHKGNYSIYAVADQLVWERDPDSAQGLAVFGRAMGAPGDRNELSFSFNGGLSLKNPLPGRDNDTAGLGVGYVRVGSGDQGLDRDTANFSGTWYPVRSGETFVEATYQAQVNPWWQIQADVQYVANVGGGIPNPNDTTQKIGNELILGVRTNITF